MTFYSFSYASILHDAYCDIRFSLFQVSIGDFFVFCQFISPKER
ncbi:hypothetical protein SLEP1_g43253 [Rubroshorea leprosula]|uniref:Uncharacterized protein n=1 Tax=Rubroshorea leprosula TaxID=152421 RepID=A0AAV5LCX8_9ROSI|nr:hypothetical protein SLEP1_g43253 [Rubroshorea leprosula]